MAGKIIFMGTPDFAVESLKKLVSTGIEIAAVVTSPDRPAGRGQLIKYSAVKEYAIENGLNVLQPEKLKDPIFIENLQAFQADLFVVVAFRMLPELVWNMPSLGTINLHGSLLPQYRGAAPINWAVLNGEVKTGATTFFLKHKIDTGDVIDQVEISISKEDSAGDVHDRLMVAGADLLAKSVQEALHNSTKAIPQGNLESGELKAAPKIFKADCKIDWSLSCEIIHNKIRGLSPYPTAWTYLEKENKKKSLKLFETRALEDGHSHEFAIKVENEQLYFGAKDGWIEVRELQLEGKKRMLAAAFVKGFDISEWNLIKES
jgi:methionyl-tRNA formyltransferase